MKILFTGGGTGGHVYPIIAIARELRRLYQRNNLELFYLGPKEDFSLILLSQEDFKIKTIISGKVRRYFSFQNIVDILFKIPLGFIQSIFLLSAINPSMVFSKGGSGSIAVTFAARILGIPVFLHESDIVPGLSNQKSAKWAKKIFVSFQKTEYFNPEKIVVTGNPIRKELTEGDKAKAAEIFNLTLSKPIFLVIGGSQGAEAINDFILLVLNDLLKKYEIIHVTGTENLRATIAEAQVVGEKDMAKYYHSIGLLDEEQMKHAYKVADLIISRSGSGSIFEIAANAKPSVLIPLPSAAGNHQFKNAYAYAETGAAVIVEQQNLKPNFLMEKIDLLFLHPEKLQEMSDAALRFAKPLAARAIAREILEYFSA